MKLMIWFMLFSLKVFGEECDTWFKNANIQKEKDCLLKCTIIPTKMNTFMCPDRCNELCKSAVKQNTFFILSDLYPGLTAAERALAAKDPTKTFKAYQLTWKAESLCSSIYSKSKINDESDACRHFIWAALLYKEFGLEFSNEVLNAHEQDPQEPQDQRSMDLANNRLGLVSGEQLSKQNSFNDTTVINSFQENLKNGNLIVLKRNHGDIK